MQFQLLPTRYLHCEGCGAWEFGFFLCPPRGEQKKPDSQIFPALNHQIYYSFYDVLGNINGKLTLKVYLEQILKPIVKPWAENHFRFVLEKDGDSGHGTGSKNIVRTWKQENKLEHYFKCASSSGLSSIENMWQVSKQELRKYTLQRG